MTCMENPLYSRLGLITTPTTIPVLMMVVSDLFTVIIMMMIMMITKTIPVTVTI